MYINRRRLKKQAKANKWYRVTRFLGIELGLCLIFLAGFLFLFHKQTKALLSPLVRVKESISEALGVSDATPQIEKLLQESHIAFTNIQAASQSAYIIVLPDEHSAVVTGEHNLATQISSLQVILNRLTMEGKRFTRLDLRFEKPVIFAK